MAQDIQSLIDKLSPLSELSWWSLLACGLDAAERSKQIAVNAAHAADACDEGDSDSRKALFRKIADHASEAAAASRKITVEQLNDFTIARAMLRSVARDMVCCLPDVSDFAIRTQYANPGFGLDQRDKVRYVIAMLEAQLKMTPVKTLKV